jgi:hypothetical protein
MRPSLAALRKQLLVEGERVFGMKYESGVTGSSACRIRRPPEEFIHPP